MTISVDDVNEAPVIDSPGRVDVDENTLAVGSAIRVSDEPFVTRVKTLGTVPSITLSGDDAALFEAVVPAGTDTVLIAFRDAPDHESPCRYEPEQRVYFRPGRG